MANFVSPGLFTFIIWIARSLTHPHACSYVDPVHGHAARCIASCANNLQREVEIGGNPRKESCAVLTRSWNCFEASSAMEERDKWRWGIRHISSQAIWSALISTWSGCWATAEQKRQLLNNGDQDASRCSRLRSKLRSSRAMREKNARLARAWLSEKWRYTLVTQIQIRSQRGNPLPCD